MSDIESSSARLPEILHIKHSFINSISNIYSSIDMLCSLKEETPLELEQDNWENVLAFKLNNKEEWEKACKEVDKLQSDGKWKCTVSLGQTLAEQLSSIAYIYKQKTDLHQDYPV